MRLRSLLRLASVVAAALCVIPAALAAQAAAQATAAPAPYRAPDEVYRAGEDLFARTERENGATARVNGVTLRYLSWGPRNGYALFWLHGLSSNRYELIEVAPRLAAAGYRVIAIDMRGHGLTQAGTSFPIQSIGDDVAALMTHLGYRCGALGGLSLGAIGAAVAYDQHPDRFTGLILEDGGSFSNQELVDRLGLSGDTSGLAQAFAPTFATKREAFDYFARLQMAIGGRTSMTPELAAFFVADLKRLPDGKWGFHAPVRELVRLDPNVRAPSGYALPLRTAYTIAPEALFRDLRVPVLIIDPSTEGSRERTAVTEMNRRLQAAHPRLIEHRIYTQTAHAAHLQRPDEFGRDALALLARARTARPSCRSRS